MISNEERREVAERLMERERGWRKMGTHLNVMPDMPATQFEDVAALLGFSGLVLDADVFARLAELIDRPTCKLIENNQHRYLPCSRCGAFIRWDAVTNNTGVVQTSYCPNCGAEVVE